MATTTSPPTAGESRSRRRARGDGGATAFNRLAATCVTLFALIWLVPFAWAVITSLRPNEDIAAHPTRPWSSNFSLDAYSYAWNTSPMGWWYVNSFVISTLAVIFAVVVCSMVAFALVHLDFRGKYAVFGADPRRPHAADRGARAAAVHGVPGAEPARHLLGGDPALGGTSRSRSSSSTRSSRGSRSPSSRLPGSTAPAGGGSTTRSSCRCAGRRPPRSRS